MKKLLSLLIFFILIAINSYAKDYVIGGGDSLRIAVWGSPDLSLDEVTVRPDGKITIPALGEIEVAGFTAVELTEILKKKMGQMVKNPIVTIIVTGMTNYKVFVIGKGATPGIFTFSRETSLLEFLSQLGALENADLHNSYVVRNKKKIKTDFYDLFEKGSIENDIILEPNDLLFIPDNFKNRITIIGAVNTPMTFPYREELTILDLILAAGGFTDFAKQNDVDVLRINKYVQSKGVLSNTNDAVLIVSETKRSGRTKISVRAKDLMKGDLTNNIRLMPGDIIAVKESMF